MNPISIVPSSQGVRIVHELNRYEVIDSLAFGMMKNNEINGLIPIEFMQSDAKRIIKYNITGMISLEKYIESILSRQKVLDLLRQLTDSFLQLKEYLIDEKMVMIGLNSIFIEPTSGRIGIICIPIQGMDSGISSTVLLRMIIQQAQFNPKEDGSYIGQLVQSVNSTKFELSEFHKLIMELIRDSVQRTMADQSNNINISGNDEYAVSVEEIGSQTEHNIDQKEEIRVEPPIEQVKDDKKKKKKKSFFQKKDKNKVNETKDYGGIAIPGMDMPSSDENVIPNGGIEQKILPIGELQNGYEQTDDPIKNIGRVISGENQAVWMQENNGNAGKMVSDHTIYLKQESAGVAFATLTRCRSNEIKAIEGNEFLIGKDAAQVDYVISDNETISRLHAKIVKQGNDYYISDANSMNHTFVDGVMLPPGSPCKLSNMSKIRLSDEEFVFQKP